MSTVDLRTEIREFLCTRRARITPEEAGLPGYGGNRRVTADALKLLASWAASQEDLPTEAVRPRS